MSRSTDDWDQLDLGQRIVRVAWMAVREHLHQQAADDASAAAAAPVPTVGRLAGRAGSEVHEGGGRQ